MNKRFPPIPQFVEPYPDESCYSILCRCMVRAAMSTGRFCQALFGKQKYLSYFLWQPFRNEEVSKWFDDALSRVQTYLLEHSCIPYRYPFMNRRRRDDIHYWYIGEELSLGYYQGITRDLGYRLWTKRFLFYCPECVKNDRKTYGETYWHMIQQLPGVYICPIHAVPLEQSAILMSNHWIDLHPAEYWLPNSEPGRETFSYEDLQLAMDSKWMMENGWKTEIKLGSLLEGLTNWQFEQAGAKTCRFTNQHIVKNETVYHILLANMKGKSISYYAERKEIIDN